MKTRCVLTLLCFWIAQPFILVAEFPYLNPEDRYFSDMGIVDYWNQRLNERFPVTYNYLLQGGYFVMPSARMGQDGEIGVGFASVPPYYHVNLRCQMTGCLELTGTYRVFRGVDDPILTPLGFGDFADKGANFKISLFQPEDSDYMLPGLAIGAEDFMGTRSFKAQYIVLTQVFRDLNLEASLGYGIGRFRGFFGGLLSMPFLKCGWPYLENIALAVEYDAIPYHKRDLEPHPKGRRKKSPINFGLKYRLWDMLDFSVSYMRGCVVACSVSAFYNFGVTKGFVPKINDPLPYQAPVNREPLGLRRPHDVMVQEMLYAFRSQGFDLYDVNLSYDSCESKVLRMNVYNTSYRMESEVRRRVTNLIAYLIPSDIDRVVVVIEDEGFPIQEYHFTMEYVRAFADQEMGPYELATLSPLTEVTFPDPCTELQLFKRHRDWWNIEIFPKTLTFFGSSKGKFKYALGVNTSLNGYLFDKVFYNITLGCIFLSHLGEVHGIDRLNPSQLPNVRSDVPSYFKQSGITLDEAYLQRNWNLSNGWYARLAAGYFEVEYAGLAAEFLYYPLHKRVAVGIEGAVFKKRTPDGGFGLTNQVRQLHGFVPHHHKFQFSQYFFDFYYEWPEVQLDFKIMVGKFLANDHGARFEIARYFPSGLKVSIWYTVTNGHDKLNNHPYYDKGIWFSMPLDIFYTYSDRSRWGYGMSAWLRDVGAFAETGKRLYDLIREQRNY